MRTDEAILVFAIMGGALLFCAYGWWQAHAFFVRGLMREEEYAERVFLLCSLLDRAHERERIYREQLGFDPREARESVFDHQKESQLGEKL